MRLVVEDLKPKSLEKWQKGRQVRFQIKNVLVPEPGEVLKEIHNEDWIRGVVADFSNSVGEMSSFAVVRVDELKDLVVVPSHFLEEVD